MNAIYIFFSLFLWNIINGNNNNHHHNNNIKIINIIESQNVRIGFDLKLGDIIVDCNEFSILSAISLSYHFESPFHLLLDYQICNCFVFLFLKNKSEK